MSLPPISYHGGHCGQYCDHAAPATTLRSVVEAYIKRGSSYFGLTEHQARLGAWLYPEEKALLRDEAYLFDNMSRYMSDARTLQKEFADAAKLLVGFETEMCDDNAFALTQKLRAQHQPDYIVGSVHHVAGQPIDFDQAMYDEAVRQQGSHDNLFARYYDQQYALMQAIQPEVIGHFDLIKIFAPQAPLTSRVRELMERNIAYAITYGAVFEVNARAFRKKLKEPYPGTEALEMIRQEGGSITLGDDSHGPDQIFAYYDQVEPFLRRKFDSIVLFRKEGKQLQRAHWRLETGSVEGAFYPNKLAV